MEVSMKRKEIYEAPVTCRTQVEMEGTFCGSIDEKKDAEVKSNEQEVSGQYEFGSDSWY